MKKQLTMAICTLACFVLTSGHALAATFTESYLDGGSWNSIVAQGFSPGVAPNPDLGLTAGQSVSLDSFEFYKSGSADNTADLKLAIISPFFSNIKTFETSSTYVIGVSDNTISGTAGIATNDPIAFQFSGLDLSVGTSYGAVLVSQSGDTLTPELVPALTANYVEDPPASGTFVPESNYGTNDQFDYAVSNFVNETITDAFFSTFSFAADANFTATFTAVPEPMTFMMGLIGLSCFAAARRRTA